MYGSELEDDEEEVEQELQAREQAKGDEGEAEGEKNTSAPAPSAQEKSQEPSEVGTEEVKKENTEPYRDSEGTKPFEMTKAGEEGAELVPKAAHDASSA